MAQAIWNEASMKLLFMNGMKENGEPNLVSKTLNDVKETATPEQVLTVADALSSIVSYTLYSVIRNDSVEINQ
ncbi:DUF1659 domain-containing protein [Bacillus sp. B1-b2]|uniref:DUF1659 domain-containing protein n=1 Tax=Bacillus sp. B1-b2 TaxID=2653201 RepID=UPI001261E883|nr:DUF1659 domain-containing protein [Bacillus sp. B1-b2]KAB7663577.1 DUF1659 domain-containing protein [Bacillus sp. B1-b2]